MTAAALANYWTSLTHELSGHFCASLNLLSSLDVVAQRRLRLDNTTMARQRPVRCTTARRLVSKAVKNCSRGTTCWALVMGLVLLIRMLPFAMCVQDF